MFGASEMLSWDEIISYIYTTICELYRPVADCKGMHKIEISYVCVFIGTHMNIKNYHG